MNPLLYLKKNSSTILTCVGALGVIATAATAVKATPKAMKIIEHDLRSDEENPKVIDIIQSTWRCYIPSILIGTATIACIFGANALSQKQQAALMSSYIFLDQSYKEYKRKLKEIYGEEADGKIREELAKEKFEAAETPTNGNLLFYEEHYGQVFERTMLEVQDAEYKLNQKFAMDGEANVNDFLELLGLSKVPIGDKLGWSQEASYDFYNYTWIEFEHILTKTNDGMECYMINTPYPPSIGYDSPKYMWVNVPF